MSSGEGNLTGTLILKMKAMQKYAAHHYPIMALLVVSLTGCAWIPSTPLVQGATTAQPIPGPTPVANGSIFQSAQPINYGYQPLFDELNGRPFVNNDHYARVLLKLD